MMNVRVENWWKENYMERGKWKNQSRRQYNQEEKLEERLGTFRESHRWKVGKIKCY